MNSRHRYLSIALAVLTACAASPALEPVSAYQAPAASFMPTVSCHTMLTDTRVDGRPLVMTRCRTVTLAMAAYHTDVVYLRQLVRSGRAVATIGDHEIRETQEYRSYMDSRNRWQWQLQVTEAEALAICRAMLADLAAGQHVDWETQARDYLMRVRHAPAAPAQGPGHAQPTQTDSSAAAPGIGPGLPAQPASPGDMPHGPGTGPVSDTPSGPSGPRSPPRVDYYYRFDDDWHLLDRLRAEGRHTAADRFEHLLDSAGTQLAAVTILLSGTSILITGLATPSGLVELSIMADGVAPTDMALATRMAEPALQQLAETVHEIEEMKGGLQSFEPQMQPGLDTLMQSRIECRKLIYQAVESLNQSDLERLQELVARTGMTGELEPGNPLHKANSWQEYLARDGIWRFDRWSITYDQNMTRATKAHQRADAYRDELGWGQREVPVMAGNDKRILDIADRALSRGVEVKTGYVPLSADVAYELKRDAWLVSEENWDIRWFVDGRMSEPLRKALRAANIQFTETKPTTLIKDL